MMPELGHFCLILALGVALAQSLIRIPAFRIRSAKLLCALTLAAFLSLVWAYVSSDFSLLNVMQNSHTLKPLIYKIAGVWGNHEGSMLLWCLMLTFFGMMVSRKRMSDTGLKSKTLGVLGTLSFGFIAFVLLTSNPFIRLPFPASEGLGLNPVLQNPILAIHPPLLYMGYVGFSVAFAFAIAGLKNGVIDKHWAAIVRPWVIWSWTALSAGIALGSWWAYEELGWGGWWFWDPVENSSLMPWLMGTALLHSIIVLEKRETLKHWCALLAILTFSLSMLGTFLVRSGVLTSVHAFASDPMRGVFILALLGLFTGGALLIYALRAHALKNSGGFSAISRESTLILNNLFMVCACATIFIGTLYPLFLDILNAGQISVGPPYFKATFIPLTIPAILLMGFAPFIAWKKSETPDILRRLKIPISMSALGTLLIVFFTFKLSAVVIAGFALALWLLCTTLYDLAVRLQLFKLSFTDSLSRAAGLKLTQWGMIAAHTGIAIAIFGMIGSTALMQESISLMKQGDRMSLGRYELKLEEVGSLMGPNYVADAARFTVNHDDEIIPSRRYYPVEQQTTTEAAIRKSLTDDLYIALGEQDKEQADHWVVRAYVHPLIPFLWLGFALVVLGGILSFIGKRNAV